MENAYISGEWLQDEKDYGTENDNMGKNSGCEVRDVMKGNGDE